MTEITQADRDAAADFLESWEPGPEMTVVKLAKAFARHRLAERAKIVAWLRELAEAVSEHGSKKHLLISIATVIDADKTFTHPDNV